MTKLLAAVFFGLRLQWSHKSISLPFYGAMGNLSDDIITCHNAASLKYIGELAAATAGFSVCIYFAVMKMGTCLDNASAAHVGCGLEAGIRDAGRKREAWENNKKCIGAANAARNKCVADGCGA